MTPQNEFKATQMTPEELRYKQTAIRTSNAIQAKAGRDAVDRLEETLVKYSNPLGVASLLPEYTEEAYNDLFKIVQDYRDREQTHAANKGEEGK